MPGTLYLVATPIGNLGDLTLRAREVLGRVAFVACEDTRRTRVLLDQHQIPQRDLQSLPAFAEAQRAGRLLDRVAAGEDCALVTDAGSPGVSDPGEAFVAQALERGIRVEPVPGPSAVIAALGASGLPTGRFHFLGFLPRKGPERKEILEEVAPLRATLALYESPRRVGPTLRDLEASLGDRRACVARELTKVHEEFARGTLSELARRFEAEETLGEVVILVEGRKGEARWTDAEVQAALEAGLSRGEKLKPLSREVAHSAGWSGQDVYRVGLRLKERG